MHFDHIGIVVKNIQDGIKTFQNSLGIKKISKMFKDEGIGVYVQFIEDSSNICYELVAPLNSDSPVYGALKNGTRIINHVAYRVSDLAVARDNMLKGGSIPATAPQPAVAYNGKKVQFFITRSKFIVELIEAEDHQHKYIDFQNL